ncbi:unnamed protein product, partial [Iphiclides podalirius]
MRPRAPASPPIPPAGVGARSLVKLASLIYARLGRRAGPRGELYRRSRTPRPCAGELGASRLPFRFKAATLVCLSALHSIIHPKLVLVRYEMVTAGYTPASSVL